MLKHASYECNQLLQQLMEVDARKRLTSDKALKHSWFRGFDWENFDAGTMKAPFELEFRS